MKLNNFKFTLFTVLILSIFLSLGSYFFYLSKGQTVAYNDARAHLDMARLVVDNLKPGLAQMGSVWLPLNHVLMLPFVWNYTLWQSGFAGSIASMISYCISAVFIYALIYNLTKKELVSLSGSLVFLLNPNILYMQTTPMTELTLIMFFTGASYFLLKWVRERRNVIYLMLCAFMVLGSTLTRYDGWFLFFCLIPIIIGITIGSLSEDSEMTVNKKIIKKTLRLIEGRVVLFSTIGGFGIFLWLIWNQLIYGQALYFMIGPYSAYAQQDKIKKAGALLTFHDFPLSIYTYWLAMVDNSGSIILLFALIGLLFFVFKNKLNPIALALFTLLTPLFFHVISLYAGNSILVVPELGSSLTQHANTSWFNVRYGMMIVPAVAVFSAYLVRKSKILIVLLLIAVLLQSSFLYLRNDVITLTDGVIGTSSLDVEDVSVWLRAHAADQSGNILTSIAFNNALAFSTGIPLKKFIHEGTGKYWTTSLKTPSKYAKWIVMANGDVGDEVYTSLIKNKSEDFKSRFSLAMKGKHTNVYERK